MTLETQTATTAGFPLAISNPGPVGVARLLLRDERGDVVQEWPVQQSKCTLGSAEACGLRCTLPGVAAYHALIVVGARQTFIRALAPKLTRGGVQVNEVLLTDISSTFEIAGHKFELSREVPKPQGDQNSSKPDRMKFTLARPFELQRRSTQAAVGNAALQNVSATQAVRQSTLPAARQQPAANALATDPTATNPMRADQQPAPAPALDPQWVAKLIRTAVAPLQDQLQNVSAPLAELQSESRRQKRLRKRRKELREKRKQEPKAERPNPLKTVADAATREIEQITIRQSVAMDVLGERISDVNQQLSTIEHMIAQERAAPDETPQPVSQQEALQALAIEQLQNGIVAVSSSLADLQSRQIEVQRDDTQWKNSIQVRLESLGSAIDGLSHQTDALQQRLSEPPQDSEGYADSLRAAEGVQSLSVADAWDPSQLSEHCNAPEFVLSETWAVTSLLETNEPTAESQDDSFENPFAGLVENTEPESIVESNDWCLDDMKPQEQCTEELHAQEMKAEQPQAEETYPVDAQPADTHDEATGAADTSTEKGWPTLEEASEEPGADDIEQQQHGLPADALTGNFFLDHFVQDELEDDHDELDVAQNHVDVVQDEVIVFQDEADVSPAEPEFVQERWDVAQENVPAEVDNVEFATDYDEDSPAYINGPADSLVEQEFPANDDSNVPADDTPLASIEDFYEEEVVSELPSWWVTSEEASSVVEFSTVDEPSVNEVSDDALAEVEQTADDNWQIPADEAIRVSDSSDETQIADETDASEVNYGFDVNDEASLLAGFDLPQAEISEREDPHDLRDDGPTGTEEELETLLEASHASATEKSVDEPTPEVAADVGGASDSALFGDFPTDALPEAVEDDPLAALTALQTAAPLPDSDDLAGPQLPADEGKLTSSELISRSQEFSTAPEEDEFPTASLLNVAADQNILDELGFSNSSDVLNHEESAMEPAAVANVDTPAVNEQEFETLAGAELPEAFLDSEVEVESQATQNPAQIAPAEIVPAEVTPAAAGQEGDDESVEDYMRRLLARMRGVPEDEVQVPKPVKPAPAPTVESDSRKPQFAELEREPSQPLQDSATQAVEPNIDSHKSMPETQPFDPEKYVPRGLDREKSSHNMQAMRELANSSARSAITSSTRQKLMTSTLMKGIIAIIAMAVSVVLIAINGLNVNVGLVATIASLLVAGIWGYDALSSLRPLMQSRAGSRQTKIKANRKAADLDDAK